MHRSAIVVIGLASLVGAAASARAGVLTQVITPVAETQGPSPENVIAGYLLSPAVGTLTGVELELKGVLIPDADVGGAADSVTLSPSLFVQPAKLGPDTFTRTFPAEAAIDRGVVGEGPAVLEIAAPTTVDETFVFTDLTRFADVHAGQQPIIDFNFGSTSSSGTVELDRTNFNGSATVTYSYSSGAAPVGVPEPASAALLGLAAFAARSVRRRGRLSGAAVS